MERRPKGVSLSNMDFVGRTKGGHQEDDLAATASEVLESLECLLYLMEKEAASPQQVKAYVAEAKKVLLTLHLRLDQDALQPNVWLM
jgi:hypothetical protein